MRDTVVIAGAGQAAAQAIISLRHGGYGGDILLVDVETNQTKEITLTPRLLDKYRAAHKAWDWMREP